MHATARPSVLALRLCAVAGSLALVLGACGSDTTTDAAAADASSETTAGAASSGVASLTVVEPWYRTSSADQGAAYLSITNDGDETVTFLSATSDAATVELHETVQDDAGVMSMEERPEGFEIAPGETLVLEPGGKHLMLIDLIPPDSGVLDLVLTFDAGTLDVAAAFDEEASASAMAEGDDHSGHDHGDDAAAEEGHDHGDEEMATDDTTGTILDTLDVQALHALDDELFEGTIDPATQRPTVEAALAAVQADGWPAEMDMAPLETALTDLLAALDAGDVDAASAAATAVHDIAHDLEHEMEHHG